MDGRPFAATSLRLGLWLRGDKKKRPFANAQGDMVGVILRAVRPEGSQKGPFGLAASG